MIYTYRGVCIDRGKGRAISTVQIKSAISMNQNWAFNVPSISLIKLRFVDIKELSTKHPEK